MSLVDMYIETGDPSEKCGELNFSLDYDFATQTLKLRLIQASQARSNKGNGPYVVNLLLL